MARPSCPSYYQPAPQVDSDPEDHSGPSKRTALQILAIGLLVAVAAFGTWNLAQAVLPPLCRAAADGSTPMMTPAPVDCGHTKDSAQAAGCVYDPMAVGWTAPHCIDAWVLADALNATSFLAPVGGAGRFRFSTTPDFAHPVPLDAPQLGAHDWLYASVEFHKAHCVYLWRALAHALERKAKGETDVYVYHSVLGYGHAEHCSWMLMDHEKDRAAPVKIQTGGTNRCVRL